jgi:hypothetical protein
MTTTIDSTQPAQAPSTKNAFQRIAGVFFSPGETFADIARRPDILVPLLVIVVIGFVSTFLVMPKLDWDAMISLQTEMIQKSNPDVSGADMERMQRTMLPFTKGLIAISPALLILGYLVIALVIWAGCRLMGGAGDFKQAFSITLYGHFPRLILLIISTVVVMAKGSVNPILMPGLVKSSVAGFANIDMLTQQVLFTLLSHIEIFKIWTLVLLVIGFAAVSKLSKAKTAAIVLSLWLLWLTVKIGIAALGAMRMNA